MAVLLATGLGDGARNISPRLRGGKPGLGALLAVLAALAVVLVPAAARAGEADVVAVAVTETGPRTYRFDVTVAHADAGWDHYADRWEVRDGAGHVLAVRKLLHPHVNEQPFTRSLGGVVVPPGVHEVIVRAHDSVHGYGGLEKRVRLP